jgi:hypothetical protein
MWATYGEVFFRKEEGKGKSKKTDVAILPTVSYNPSFGFLLGGSIDAGAAFGNGPETIYSTFGLSASVTTKGNVSTTVRHNIFTPATSGICKATGRSPLWVSWIMESVQDKVVVDFKVKELN